MHSRSFHPSHTLSDCCIGVACVTHECLTILGQTLSLCVSVHASALPPVHRVLDFNLPHPSLAVIHCSSAQRMKTATENHFVFMAETLPGRFPTACSKYKLCNGKTIRSTMETNVVPCSILLWPGCPACSPSHSHTAAAVRRSPHPFHTATSRAAQPRGGQIKTSSHPGI